MKRVMIIGCGGAGKSTLARQLGGITGLPVVHLDQIWWSPGHWQHMEREAFDAILQREMEKEMWILDGNYNRTMSLRLEKCDTVIYLDKPRLVCLLQWMKRVIQNWGHARQDMAPGCAEWFDPEMAGWIWGFHKANRKKYYNLLAQQENKTVVILKNRRQVRKFLKNVENSVG